MEWLKQELRRRKLSGWTVFQTMNPQKKPHITLHMFRAGLQGLGFSIDLRVCTQLFHHRAPRILTQYGWQSRWRSRKLRRQCPCLRFKLILRDKRRQRSKLVSPARRLRSRMPRPRSNPSKTT